MIIDQRMIYNSQDVLKLKIIDWNRLNGYWNNPAEALDAITSWFAGNAYYSIIEHDIRAAPQRDDFPGWKHVGAHEEIGELFWNDFHDRLNGKLTFSDSPDFYGELYGEDGKVGNLFWGDIGQVSASAFAHTQKQLSAHDLWISVLSETRQIIIEPLIDINSLYNGRFQMNLDNNAVDKLSFLAREEDGSGNPSWDDWEKALKN